MPNESLWGPIGILALMLFLLAAFVAWIFLFITHGLAKLRRWAAENGFQIVCVYRRSMTGNPFPWWGNTRDRATFHVRVRDREGKERTGWVRCQIWFGSKAEVRWDGP